VGNRLLGVNHWKLLPVELLEITMTLRLTFSVADRGYSAKVYRDTEWNEFRVRFFDTDGYCAMCDYHTDDEEDALDTAASIVNKLVSSAN
jgi:hypothetical protein